MVSDIPDAPRGDWSVTVSPRTPVAGIRMLGFSENTGQAFDEAVLPSPSVGIVIDCGERSLRTETVDSPALVSGIISDGRVRGEGIECLEIQLSPMAAAAVFDVHPGDLNHAFLPLEQLWGGQALQLVERLRATSDWRRRFSIATRTLAAHYTPRRGVDAEVADAWRRIVDTAGRVSVRDLSQRYGWNRTRLWKRFSAQLGVSPKFAMRVARFDRALRGVSHGRSLAEVAIGSGYTDQSHMYRDFHRFTGATPRSFQGDQLWSIEANTNAL